MSPAATHRALQAAALLQTARALLPDATVAASPGADPRRALTAVTDAVLARLGQDPAPGPDEHAALIALGVRAQDAAAAFQEQARATQQDLRRASAAGLSRLHELGSTAELVDGVCEEAIRSCGFARVLLSRVEGPSWRPWKFRASGDEALEASFRAMIDGLDMALAQTPVELRILERRRPALVRDARQDPTPMTRALRSSSYVVVPITPAGRVVGLLHADHGEGSAVDEIDRDLLWTFAEGFGRIYERTELRKRLRAQRARAGVTLEAVSAVAAAVDDAVVELTREPAERGPLVPAGPATLPAAALESLTGREREVLALLTRGYGNAAIARELFITEGTAKTHVARILRKLGAPNRAAVAGLGLGQPDRSA